MQQEPGHPTDIFPYEFFHSRRRFGPAHIRLLISGSEQPCTEEDLKNIAPYYLREVMRAEEFKNFARAHCILRDVITSYTRDAINDSIDPAFFTQHALTHPNYEGFRLEGFSYIIYKPHKALLDLPNIQSINVGQMLLQGNNFLYFLHQRNFIHGNLHPCMCAQLDDAPTITYAFRVDKNISHQSQMTSYSDSWILSPLQVILEMLGSSIEPPEIEYNTFKTRLIAFWTHLLNYQLGSQYPQTESKRFFSASNGCSDFIDYCIMRYCQLTPDGKYIIKDRSKALGYLKDIDLFALAMCACEILSRQRQLQNASQVLNQAIGMLVRGDYIAIPNPPQLSSPPPPAKEKTTQKEPEQPKQEEQPKQQETPTHEEQPKQEESNKITLPTPTPVIEREANDTNDDTDNDKPRIEITPGTKKARIYEPNSKTAVERIVRSDAMGEYVMWRGNKLYVAKTLTFNHK